MTFSTEQTSRCFPAIGANNFMKKGIFFVNAYGCPDVSGDLEKMFLLMKETGTLGLQFHISELMRLDKENFKKLLEKNNASPECVHVTPRLFSEDENVFLEAVKECEHALDYISSFGCKYLMVAPFHPSDVKDRQKALERFAKGLELVVAKAETYGISVVIENISLLILPFSTPEDVEYLLDKVKGLKFCFDTGNFVCTKHDTVDTFERLKDRICMVHVKDFGICKEGGYVCDSGLCVEHVDFGKGEAKLEEVLSLLYRYKPDITYVVEVHNEMPPKDDVVKACSFVDRVWEECRK